MNIWFSGLAPYNTEDMKSIIKLFVPPIFEKISHLIKRKSRYQIGKYRIRIPLDHQLPLHQEKHKLYDRFLPVLVSKIDSKGLVIDIGANIGHTTIAMLQKSKNQFYCIEPSDYFFPYLENNISSLSMNKKKRVKCYKNMIGTSAFTGTLLHSGHGTASLVTNDKGSNKNEFISLDKLLFTNDKIALIKVDTDGFDFDVLLSGKDTIIKSEPILFWENQIKENYQIDGFNNLYITLEKIGYSYIYIFDNFGNIIFEESNFDTLKKLNKYIHTMDNNNATRTIYYTDILAATKKNYPIVKQAINEYRQNWILGNKEKNVKN